MRRILETIGCVVVGMVVLNLNLVLRSGRTSTWCERWLAWYEELIARDRN